MSATFPKFVRIGSGSAFRWTGKEYWVDAGAWGMPAKYDENGVLRMVSHMKNLDGLELVPCTEAEWRKANGRWAPK